MVPLGSEIMKYVVASATSVATAVKRIKVSNVVDYVQIPGEARAWLYLVLLSISVYNCVCCPLGARRTVCV